MRPTLHLLGLPHTQLTRDASVCAFTQKAVKFVRMMQAEGWPVVTYWGDRDEAGADEHVVLFTEAEQEGWYGTFDPNRLPSIATWNAADAHWQALNQRAVAALSARLAPRDLILSLAGWAHKPVTDAFPAHLSCEWAAGYSGWCEPFVCFESSAWRHHQYGTRGMHDGRWYDTVIPNFFDPDEWTLPVRRGDHLVFVGRMVQRKGVQVAADVARAAGLPIVFAGSGVRSWTPERIVCDEMEVVGEQMTYVGTVGGEARNRLMRDALAVLAPTTYVEPFGAVAVEAQLCGTPAITTDFGAFPETVVEGVTGFRMRTLGDGVDAVERARGLRPAVIRQQALARYSLEAVGPLYTRWFDQLLGLWGDGWYTVKRREPRQGVRHHVRERLWRSR